MTSDDTQNASATATSEGEAPEAGFRPGEIAGVTPALIGRNSELQSLLERLYIVLEAGDAQLVTVTGMPGVGKSRLAYELRRMVARLPESVQVFAVDADPQMGARPYGLVRALVMAFLRIRESDAPARARLRLEQGLTRLTRDPSPAIAHLIGQLLGFDFSDSPFLAEIGDDQARLRELAYAGARACVAALAAQSPVVLILDDFHYADDSSLDLLAYLTREGHGLPLMICCLARRRFYDRHAGWGEGLSNATRLALQPLSERDSRQLIGEILRKAGKLSSDLRNLIVSRAEGNPLYVEELVRMLIADGVIAPGESHWQVMPARLMRLRMPSSLRELLVARLQTLPLAERDLLERAAVVGRSFWVDAAQALAEPAPPLSTVAHLVDSLIKKEIIGRHSTSRFSGEEEFFFRHTLMHEVVYERVMPAMRRQHHTRIARWLIERGGEEADAYATLVAEHFEQAGASEEAARWHARAAFHAQASNAGEAAVESFRRALSLLPDRPDLAGERHGYLNGLADVLYALTRLSEAAAVYEQAAALSEATGDHEGHALALFHLARVYDIKSEYQRALDYARQAVAVARRGDAPGALGMALTQMAWELMRLDQPQEAHDLGDQALALFSEIGDRDGIAQSYGILSGAYEMLNRFEDAMASLEQSVALHRELRNYKELVQQLNNLGYLANSVGDWGRALEVLEESIELSRRIGNRSNEIYVLSNRCISLAALGHLTQAEEAARRGIQLCEQSRLTPFTDFYWALTDVALARGRAAEALEAAQQSLELARSSGTARELGISWRFLGRAFTALEDSFAATPCFSESARLLRDLNARAELARTLRDWAYHAYRSGDMAIARARWDEARATFAELGLAREVEAMDADPLR